MSIPSGLFLLGDCFRLTYELRVLTRTRQAVKDLSWGGSVSGVRSSAGKGGQPLISRRPIEPGKPSPTGPPTDHARPLEPSRADLIFTLGFLSLFLCAPLGIIAWFMGNSELRKIEAGRVSRQRAGTVKTGKWLGIIGTLVFPFSVALIAAFVTGLLPEATELVRSEPLKPDQVIYVGEWFGNKGTFIRIHYDGKADFKTHSTSVKGGRAKIDEESLSIGFMAIRKTWRIRKKPYMENGNWRMDLDGEIFSRKSDDLMVIDPGSQTPVRL